MDTGKRVNSIVETVETPSASNRRTDETLAEAMNMDINNSELIELIKEEESIAYTYNPYELSALRVGNKKYSKSISGKEIWMSSGDRFKYSYIHWKYRNNDKRVPIDDLPKDLR